MEIIQDNKMATFKDILANSSPDELQSLLSKLKTDNSESGINESEQKLDTPIEPKKDVQPTPVSPQMLGMPSAEKPGASIDPLIPSKPNLTNLPDDKNEENDEEDDITPSKSTDKSSDVSGHYAGGGATKEQQDNLKKALGEHFEPVQPTTINTVENLKAAQDAADKQTNIANLMKGIGTLNSGLIAVGSKGTGSVPNTEANNKFFYEYEKQ
jgi:hypothetical protein